MRGNGLWHPRLLAVIAGMGHTETLVVADPGLPVPSGVETIDLVWARNQPRLLPVLEAVCAELVVEEAVIAEELCDEALLEGIGDVTGPIPVKTTSHEDFKTRHPASRRRPGRAGGPREPRRRGRPRRPGHCRPRLRRVRRVRYGQAARHGAEPDPGRRPA